jgi:hypothetical protein
MGGFGVARGSRVAVTWMVGVAETSGAATKVAVGVAEALATGMGGAAPAVAAISSLLRKV